MLLVAATIAMVPRMVEKFVLCSPAAYYGDGIERIGQ
jgi:hypothetical protein